MMMPEVRRILRVAQLTGCLPFSLGENQISFSWYDSRDVFIIIIAIIIVILFTCKMLHYTLGSADRQSTTSL